MARFRRWREVWPLLVPQFLRRGDGGKTIFSLMVLQDAVLERAKQGLELRFPTRSLSASGLALTALDRGIPRGVDESAAAYAARVLPWTSLHRRRGTPWAVLELISAYFGGIDCDLYQGDGTKWSRSAAGVNSVTYGGAWDWGPSETGGTWGRFWIVLKGTGATATPDFGDSELYGGATGNDAFAVGHAGVSAREALGIRGLFSTLPGRGWFPGGITPMCVIVSLDGSDPVPAGDWQTYRNTSTGAARTDREDFRFWALSDAFRLYRGDGTEWPSYGTPLPDGTEYDADLVWHETIERPDGAGYAGVPTWREGVSRVDDGDIPA